MSGEGKGHGPNLSLWVGEGWGPGPAGLWGLTPVPLLHAADQCR